MAFTALWNLMRRRPLVALAAMTALQTAFTFGTRALWFSDEVRYADAYAGLLRGKWLVLQLNGVAYPDKPPLYFWLVRILDLATGLGDPAVFFLAAAVSGWLVLLATQLWARALDLPEDAGLLAGLILLGTLFFAGLLHYSRMDLLFAALITASQAAFCLAFKPGGEAKRGRMAALALFLAALATLTKGPLGLVFPVLTTLLFLAWRGRAREFFSRALLPGLGVLLGVVAAWVLSAYAIEGPGFLYKIFVEQIFLRATKTFHHAEPWWFYLVAFPPCWLPWMLTPLALPGSTARLLGAAHWRAQWAGRKAPSPQADARLWLWLSAGSGLALLSLLSGKVVVYVLPQLPPLALLLALSLGNGRLPWRRLWTAAGLFFLALAGLVAQGARLLPEAIVGPLAGQGGLPGALAVAAGFAACGLLLVALRKSAPALVLTGLALAMPLWVQPASQTLAPALDQIMSPRVQALVLKEYAAQGHLPVAHDIYQGIYSYYLGATVRETASFEALDALMAGRDVVLAIKKKKWNAWTTRPEGMTIVLEQWLAGQTYYVAVGRGAEAPPRQKLPDTP